MGEVETATDAQVERWAETGTGYSVEEDLVRVANGAAMESYRVTPAQRQRLVLAAAEHATDPVDSADH